MVHAVAEDQILKVHRAGDGSVWFLAGAGAAVQSPLSLHDFPAGPEVAQHQRVRLLGTWANAPLVTRFAALKSQRQLVSVAVASPRVGQTRRERGDPVRMLTRMRTVAWPASLGGYHEVSALDLGVYQIATQMQQGVIPPMWTAQLLVSPLWRYLSFIPHLSTIHVAELLATILDPRWFVGLDDIQDECSARAYVNRGDIEANRLTLSLGLEPSTMATSQGCYASPHRRELAATARTALAAWKTTQAPPPDVEDHPGLFLWRRWQTYGDPAKADLRTTKLFVNFVRLCWLDAIYRERFCRDSESRPDGLFAPDHFFDSATALAFRRHLATYAT